jgi:arginase
MEIALIAAPYFLGHPDRISGRGPERLLDAGLERALADQGHRPRVTAIEVPEPSWDEIGTSFSVIRATAARVGEAVADGALPIVLAGNCGTASLGSLAGLAPQEVGIVWFDAHGDFNTPETTPSGFFDGMPLAIAVGDCWRTLRQTIPGFHPVPAERVVLIGGRDFDAEEQERFAASAIAVVAPERVREEGAAAALAASLAALRARVAAVYLHVDLDVLDPSEGRANSLAVPGGLSVNEVRTAIRAVGEQFTIAGAGLTAYDPSLDSDGRVASAALQIATEIAESAAATPS